MNRRWIIGLLVFAIISPMACGMAKEGQDAASAPMLSAMEEGSLPAARRAGAGLDEAPTAPGAPSSDAPAMRRMIILTGNMTVEVDRFVEKAETLRKAISDLGGYASGSDERVDPSGHRYGTLTFRLPSAKWNEALAAARALGKVLEESSRGDDVSEEYYDIEARLAADKKLEAELMKLLNASQRGRLADLLEISREIARVRGEIESKEGRLRYLSNMVSLSTLTVQLKEPAALVQVKPGALDPITDALGESVSVFAGSLGAVVIFIAAVVPWLVLIWVFVILIRWWWRRRRR
jgi:predicted house-cleaning noncanonical NTP pyrophosphatase (MazG superfamily)